MPEFIRRLFSETLAEPRDARWWRVFDGLETGGRFSRQVEVFSRLSEKTLRRPLFVAQGIPETG